MCLWRALTTWPPLRWTVPQIPSFTTLMAAQLLVTGTEGHHNEEETRSKPTDSRLLLLSLAVRPDSISIRQDSSRPR